MIEIWCRHHHGTILCSKASEKGLCPDCKALLDYSLARLDHCKFGNDKTKCHKCPIHCYKPDMREQIRAVMRFSGPRMLFYHPIEAIRYLIEK